MTSPGAQGSGAVAGRSLTRALTSALEQAGERIDENDLHVGLGLGLLFCSVPYEPDWGVWSAYARDAFLESGAKLFGLGLRHLHPPDAARGLSDAGEFAQHFDASYRPLIVRALEHDQPVLAWRGWGGMRAPAWGLIDGVCAAGAGFRGVAFGVDDGADGVRTALVEPPAQVYVVESGRLVEPEPRALAGAIVANAAAALDGSLDDRFGVVTGGPALGEWGGLLNDIPEDVPAFVLSHVVLGRSYLSGLHAMAGVLDRIMRCDVGDRADASGAVRECAGTLIDRLAPLGDAEVVETAVMAPQDMAALRERIVEAKRTVDALAARLAASRG